MSNEAQNWFTVCFSLLEPASIMLVNHVIRYKTLIGKSKNSKNSSTFRKGEYRS